MAKLQDSPNFLPNKRVSFIAETTPLKDLIPRLSEDKIGFVIKSSDQAHYQGYVSGLQLVNFIKGGKWHQLKDKEIISLIADPQVEVTMIPMSNNVLQKDEDDDVGILLSTQSQMIPVIESAEYTAGYMLPPNAIQTPPRTFYCSNPIESHPNAQRGSCSSCPFPVE